MKPFEMTSSTALPNKDRIESRRNIAAFWLLGVFNNAAYVIMIAGALTISSAAVGLVYICAVLPSLLLKVAAPYFIHKIAYPVRIIIAAALMAGSYTTVALSTTRTPQLIGVVMASLQGALGEASLLALTSQYNSQVTLTAWSSGTGFAGVFGYTWVSLLHVVLGLRFSTTLLSAQITVGAFLATYFMVLEAPEARSLAVRQLMAQDEQLVGAAMAAMDGSGFVFGGGGGRGYSSHSSHSNSLNGVVGDDDDDDDDDDRRTLLPPTSGGEAEKGNERSRGEYSRRGSPPSPPPPPPLATAFRRSPPCRRSLGKTSKIGRMSLRERFLQTLVLWPYTIPLFMVYAAEYVMQAGVWVSIGLPDVQNAVARQTFYVYSNWCYQAGVFVSRSSGTVWKARRRALWVMPVLQIGLLGMFLAVAVTHFWYNYWLLVPCFAAGLLGGAVYVNSFTLIAREVEPQYVEFSLGAASVADSLGIAVADVVSVFLQGCLFKVNKVEGADFTC